MTQTANTASIDVASDEEMTAYTQAYIATSNALGDAIIILVRLEARTFDPDERREIVIARRRLEDECAENERSFHAVMSEGMAMNPPSQADVDAIVALASEVAQLTQQVTKLRAVMRLASDVATKFQDIRSN